MNYTANTRDLVFNSFADALLGGERIAHFTMSNGAACLVTSDGDDEFQIHLMRMGCTDGVLSFAPHFGLTATEAANASAALYAAHRWVEQANYGLRETQSRQNSFGRELELALQISEMSEV